ncbi:MAG TPA: aminotransferase class I/II-fold pyridoxal phosphate-dependent enzyme [Chitinophagales bacterium]|nr:aminotransferase class I/II-fold pyridoxal phosphate-dependent enzyme [Chitinophagales bacterium]
MIQPANRIAEVEEYYFSKKLAEIRGLDSPGFPVINLGIGSPDLAPSDKAVKALIDTAKKPDSHGYQSYKGIPQLRKAIAGFSKRIYNITLDPETMILPLMGSKEGIVHITLAFVNECDEALIPNPGYPTYSSAARLAGARLVTYELKEELDWGVDTDALRKKDLSRVKVMWVNFPHMPTGRVATRNELKALVDLAREKNFLIINDNPYSLILNDCPLSILNIEGAEDVALELNSLSKSHNMAGWRVGWVAGKKEYMDAILRVKSNMDSGMFLGIQQAAAEALQNGNGWFNRQNEIYSKRKAVACKILNELCCTYSPNQSGLFVWAKAPDAVPDVEQWLDELLHGTNVFITPGFIFGDAGKRFIRLSLCSPVEKMEEALVRIKKFKI